MKKLFSLFAFSFLALVLALPSSAVAATAHTWAQTYLPGSPMSIVASDADGSNLIAARQSGRLYTSSDGGANWTERQPAGDVDINWTSVASDDDGSNLIAVAFNGRLYTSSDGGANWTERQPQGDVDGGWYSVASDADGSNLIATDAFGPLYTSSNGGANWTERQPAGQISGATVASDADGSNLIVGAFSGLLYTSDDGGVSWTPRIGSKDWKMSTSDADGSHLLVGSAGSFADSGRLFMSDDSGATWQEVQPVGDVERYWTTGDIDADGTHIIVGSLSVSEEFQGRLYSSDDSGNTWVEEQPAGDINISWGGVASDDDGTNLMATAATQGLFLAPDSVGPTVSSFDPADDAVEVVVDGTFDIVFDEDIATSTGNITLHKTSDDSLVETIDIAGPKVALSDTDTLTIDPTTTLEIATEYYFLIDAGAVEDVLGNSFAGISDPTTWSFTTDALPNISSLTPEDNGIDVALNLLSNGNAYIYFDQNVVAGTGNVTLKKVSDDSTVVALDVNDPEGYVYFDGTSISLYYPVDLEYATEYYFLIDATAIEDENGNAFVGIADTTTWNFTTRDAPLPPTFDFERVSINDEGVEGDGGSGRSALSADGRYVAFQSGATNLVVGDTNGTTDIFVYDRTLDTIERVSVDDLGAETDDSSEFPALSADGRYVAFSSNATNLVAGDTNDTTDIFVYDRDTNTIERVSVDDLGAETDGSSQNSALSADGRYVAFASDATNLVAGDTNDVRDIFVYDRDTNTIERVSINDGEEEGDNTSGRPVLSADGRYVAFESGATNLVAGDTNDVGDVFVYDRDTNTIERVSVDDLGAETDDSSIAPQISADGRYVVFKSFATNLTDDEVNGSGATFLHDRTLDTTELIGIEYIEGNVYVDEIVLSTDGRYVVYSAYDESESNLHIYRYDTETDTELLITEGVGGADGYASVESPAVSSDGSVISFTSENTDLVADDTNGDYDIFVWEEVVDEETPAAEEEDGSSRGSSSHRRSGGGSSSNGDATLLESLLARVQELKIILASLLGTPSTTSGDYTRDLDLNSEGPDVTQLQLFLIAQNKGPQAQALAAVGATGFFGPLTQAALAEFQASVGITPASGYFGPVTRAYLISIGAWN